MPPPSPFSISVPDDQDLKLSKPEPRYSTRMPPQNVILSETTRRLKCHPDRESGATPQSVIPTERAERLPNLSSRPRERNDSPICHPDRESGANEWRDLWWAAIGSSPLNPTERRVSPPPRNHDATRSRQSLPHRERTVPRPRCFLTSNARASRSANDSLALPGPYPRIRRQKAIITNRPRKQWGGGAGVPNSSFLIPN